MGYTAASNQGLLGAAFIESPVVDFVTRDLEDEDPFVSLHGTSVEVTISSTIFVQDGGIATLKVKLLANDSMPAREITFTSDECTGFSASISDIHFTSTLLQLPQEEQDPSGAS